MIKNTNGSCVLATCRREEISVDLLVAEAIGIGWCLQLALGQHISSMVVFTKALNVVNCFIGTSISSISNIVVLDCKSLMDQFNIVAVKHIERNSNGEAHALANYANSIGSRLWLGNVPPLASL